MTGAVASALGRLPLGWTLQWLLYRAIGLYQLICPHAPNQMYDSEVRFYSQIRPELPGDIETPRCFGSSFDPESGQFGIILEDLQLRGATFPNACDSLELATIRQLLTQLARLHGQYVVVGRGPIPHILWCLRPRITGLVELLHSHGFYGYPSLSNGTDRSH